MYCRTGETPDDQTRDRRGAGGDRRAAGVEGRESLQGPGLPGRRAGAGDDGGGSGQGRGRRPARDDQGHRRGAGEKNHRVARHGPAGFLRETARRRRPPGLVEMLEIPGLGAKKIKALHERLGVNSDRRTGARPARTGRVAALDGFGEKTQEKILAGIRNREAYGRRHLWWEACGVAEPILQGLRALPQVRRAEACGQPAARARDRGRPRFHRGGGGIGAGRRPGSPRGRR